MLAMHENIQVGTLTKMNVLGWKLVWKTKKTDFFLFDLFVCLTNNDCVSFRSREF